MSRHITRSQLEALEDARFISPEVYHEALLEIADHLIANGVSLETKQATSDKTSDENKRLTNAYRIRAMSDEELAEFLGSTHSNLAIKLGGEYLVRAKEYIEIWLKQPAPPEEDGAM